MSLRWQVQVQRLIAGCTKAFPNHCLWMLAASLKSSNRDRQAGAQLVADHVVSVVGPEKRALVKAHAELSAHLLVRAPPLGTPLRAPCLGSALFGGRVAAGR